MTQPTNLLELIEQVKPIAALFTTYTFDVKYFDAVVLPVLKHVGCRTISVLVDAEKAAKCASDFTSRAAGRKYRLSTVIAPRGGVFHPKLAYLVGKSDHALSVGSGNLTAAGLAVQLESFDAVSALQTPTVFAELKDWMLQLADSTALKSQQATEELKTFAIHATDAIELHKKTQAGKIGYLAIADRRPPVLVHTLNTCARKTLQDIFLDRFDGAKSVTVLAPFHAPDGKPVLSLAKAIRAKTLYVGLDARASSLTAPFDEKRFKRPKWCKFVVARLGDDDEGETEVAHHEEEDGEEGDEEQDTRTIETRGRLHAKVFVLEGKNESLVMTGSVNATAQSFDGTANVEVSLARWLPKSPFGWKVVEPEIYASTQDQTEFKSRRPFYVEASLDGDALEGVISPPGAVVGNVHLEMTNGGKSIFSTDVQLTDGGEFTFSLTAEFDKNAGLQLVARHGTAATADCFVSINEELDESMAEPGGWEPRDRDALGRLRGGLCSLDDLTQLLKRFVSAKSWGDNSQGAANTQRPGSGNDHGPKRTIQAFVSSSRTLAEISRAARLVAEALLAPTLAIAVTPLGLRGNVLPRPSRIPVGKSRRSNPGTRLRKARPKGNSGELAQFRIGLFWDIQQLHETKPKHADSLALAAFAAKWALDLGSLQKDGPEFCSIWLERFSWHQYGDGEHSILCPMAATLACIATVRLEQQGKEAPLSLLREAVEFFAGEDLSQPRFLALYEVGIKLDTFAMVNDAEQVAAREVVGRLAAASQLDEKVLALLRKARTEAWRTLTTEPEAFGFENIAKELKRRPSNNADLLRGLVSKGADGCPFCYQVLKDEHRSALRKYHMALHERGCGMLLFQSLNEARLRRGIEGLPDA